MDRFLTVSQLRNKALVEDRLKAIAAQLIAAHRRRQHEAVLPYARQAGIPFEGRTPQRLFMQTIQVFHPDRLAVLWSQIEAADRVALERLAALLEFHTEPPRRVREVEWEDEEEEEEYGYDDEDLERGYDEDEVWDPDAGTFFSAVKRELFGNLDLYPDPSDLAKLEGELDLSDYDLADLGGIEHCTGLSSLNLAQNAIDNVFPLKDLSKLEALDLAENALEDADALGGLTSLRELDLSANGIDDVAFLERLPNLRYVDLTGNPVRTRSVLERLERRGVIVII